MSEISLEWFFQIPGLFITVGVLLILIALLSLVGSFSGLSLGVFTGTVFKFNENAKTGIDIAYSYNKGKTTLIKVPKV